MDAQPESGMSYLVVFQHDGVLLANWCVTFKSWFNLAYPRVGTLEVLDWYYKPTTFDHVDISSVLAVVCSVLKYLLKNSTMRC